MRVIAGTYRSRQLVAPRGSGTRPTSDRLRETLFNVLAPRISGARFADLYAGTGAVGIEALSRGAAHVYFAEKAPHALSAIRENFKALKIDSAFTIDDRGTSSLLERLAKSAEKVAATTHPDARLLAAQLDLIFFDPPWEAEAEYAATLNFLGSARGRTLLASNALIVGEHSSKSPLAASYGSLAQTRTLKQGDAALTFFALS